MYKAVRFALLLVGLMFSASIARADLYDFSGTVGNILGGGPAGTFTGLSFTGTLDIDTVTSTVSGSLTLQGDANNFAGFFGCDTFGVCTYYFNNDPGNTFAEYGYLGLTNAGNLSGYSGGPILPDSYIYITADHSQQTPGVAYDLTGTLTAAGAVPEPSSLMLLVSGVAALAGLKRRKQR